MILHGHLGMSSLAILHTLKFLYNYPFYVDDIVHLVCQANYLALDFVFLPSFKGAQPLCSFSLKTVCIAEKYNKMFFTLSFCVYAAFIPLNCFNDSSGSLRKPYLFGAPQRPLAHSSAETVAQISIKHSNSNEIILKGSHLPL